jgi:hypothetical protein
MHVLRSYQDASLIVNVLLFVVPSHRARRRHFLATSPGDAARDS